MFLCHTCAFCLIPRCKLTGRKKNTAWKKVFSGPQWCIFPLSLSLLSQISIFHMVFVCLHRIYGPFRSSEYTPPPCPSFLKRQSESSRFIHKHTIVVCRSPLINENIILVERSRPHSSAGGEEASAVNISPLKYVWKSNKRLSLCRQAQVQKHLFDES